MCTLLIWSEDGRSGAEPWILRVHLGLPIAAGYTYS